MIARLILYDQDGKKVAHPLSLHHRTPGTSQLKLVLGTSTEYFEPWLFFFYAITAPLLKPLTQRPWRPR